MRVVLKSPPVSTPTQSCTFALVPDRLPNAVRYLPRGLPINNRHEIDGQSVVVIAQPAACMGDDAAGSGAALRVDCVLFREGAEPSPAGNRYCYAAADQRRRRLNDSPRKLGMNPGELIVRVEPRANSYSIRCRWSSGLCGCCGRRRRMEANVQMIAVALVRLYALYRRVVE